jgi:hypothetical protein
MVLPLQLASTIAMCRSIDSVDEPGNDVDVAAENAFLKLNVQLVQHTDNFHDAIVTAPTSMRTASF